MGEGSPNTVREWAERYLREMIGVIYSPAKPNQMKGPDLKAIGQAIFTANGDVKDL